MVVLVAVFRGDEEGFWGFVFGYAAGEGGF